MGVLDRIKRKAEDNKKVIQEESKQRLKETLNGDTVITTEYYSDNTLFATEILDQIKYDIMKFAPLYTPLLPKRIKRIKRDLSYYCDGNNIYLGDKFFTKSPDYMKHKIVVCLIKMALGMYTVDYSRVESNLSDDKMLFYTYVQNALLDAVVNRLIIEESDEVGLSIPLTKVLSSDYVENVLKKENTATKTTCRGNYKSRPMLPKDIISYLTNELDRDSYLYNRYLECINSNEEYFTTTISLDNFLAKKIAYKCTIDIYPKDINNTPLIKGLLNNYKELTDKLDNLQDMLNLEKFKKENESKSNVDNKQPSNIPTEDTQHSDMFDNDFNSYENSNSDTGKQDLTQQASNGKPTEDDDTVLDQLHNNQEHSNQLKDSLNDGNNNSDTQQYSQQEQQQYPYQQEQQQYSQQEQQQYPYQQDNSNSIQGFGSHNDNTNQQDNSIQGFGEYEKPQQQSQQQSQQPTEHKSENTSPLDNVSQQDQTNVMNELASVLEPQMLQDWVNKCTEEQSTSVEQSLNALRDMLKDMDYSKEQIDDLLNQCPSLQNNTDLKDAFEEKFDLNRQDNLRDMSFKQLMESYNEVANTLNQQEIQEFSKRIEDKGAKTVEEYLDILYDMAYEEEKRLQEELMNNQDSFDNFQYDEQTAELPQEPQDISYDNNNIQDYGSAEQQQGTSDFSDMNSNLGGDSHSDMSDSISDIQEQLSEFDNQLPPDIDGLNNNDYQFTQNNNNQNNNLSRTNNVDTHNYDTLQNNTDQNIEDLEEQIKQIENIMENLKSQDEELNNLLENSNSNLQESTFNNQTDKDVVDIFNDMMTGSQGKDYSMLLSNMTITNSIVNEYLVVKLKWYKELEGFLQVRKPNKMTGYQRPNKKYVHSGTILPSKAISNKTNDINFIRIFCDTSGSMTDKDRKILMGVIERGEKIFPKKTEAYQFNDVAKKLKTSNGKLLECINGTGGTDIESIFPFMPKKDSGRCINIVISDGYFSWLSLESFLLKNKKEIVVLVLTDPHFDLTRYENYIKSIGKRRFKTIIIKDEDMTGTTGNIKAFL